MFSSYTAYFHQVCVQLPTSAVNVTLLAFAAERHAAARSCGAVAAGCLAAATDLPTQSSAANPPHAADRRTDRQMDRQCSTVS